jgi:uncharacterized protein YrrD
MLQLSDLYINRRVLSLRTGSVIGHAYSPVINPDNLKIVGWYASANGEKGTMILPASEVRDMISKGIVVNDHDAITHPDDLVRFKDILNVNFELIGKTVVTDNKKRLGKVLDYSVDSKSMYVQKIYVSQSLFKGLNKTQLIIDRDQIIEITDKKIIVKELDQKVEATGTAPVPAA